MDRTILHCDLNNFFASVECLEHPEWKDVPMAVCGDAQLRHGIVLAKNELAKGFGVKTAETVWQAKMKCPQLLTVPPHHERYAALSLQVRAIYARFTDQIQPFGIDEAWLDVTGSRRLFGDGETIAHTLRELVKSELGLTISVGVSFNKVFAKLGSDMKKPDAVTCISRENFRERIWGLPAGSMLGVGPNAAQSLAAFGIRTIGDLAGADVKMLEYRLGSGGRTAWLYANGLDDSPVSADTGPVRSVGRGETTPEDLRNNEQVHQLMRELWEDVARRLRREGLQAQGVQISIRDSRLKTVQFQCTFTPASANEQTLCKKAFALFCQRYDWACPIRTLTVRAIHLTDEDEPRQMDLFGEETRREKTEQLDRTADALRKRFGRDCLRSAALTVRPPAQDAADTEEGNSPEDS